MTATENAIKRANSNIFLKIVRNQLFIPLVALLLLVIFNLVTDPGFFKIALEPNSDGNLVLSGNLITMIDYASELVILDLPPLGHLKNQAAAATTTSPAVSGLHPPLPLSARVS